LLGTKTARKANISGEMAEERFWMNSRKMGSDPIFMGLQIPILCSVEKLRSLCPPARPPKFPGTSHRGCTWEVANLAFRIALVALCALCGKRKISLFYRARFSIIWRLPPGELGEKGPTGVPRPWRTPHDKPDGPRRRCAARTPPCQPSSRLVHPQAPQVTPPHAKKGSLFPSRPSGSSTSLCP
jgi:hypothetical protein